MTAANIPTNAFDGANLVFVSGLSNDSADCFPDIIRQAKAAGAFVATNPARRLYEELGFTERVASTALVLRAPK